MFFYFLGIFFYTIHEHECNILDIRYKTINYYTANILECCWSDRLFSAWTTVKIVHVIHVCQ